MLSIIGDDFFSNKLCFPKRSHDSNHWKTAPTWNDEPFCFCMNANNNTYSCIRTINQTHNFLYCEFTTGLVTFYNLRIGRYFLVRPLWISNAYSNSSKNSQIHSRHRIVNHFLALTKNCRCTTHWKN